MGVNLLNNSSITGTLTVSSSVTAPQLYISGGTGTNYLDVISNDLYIVAAEKQILYSGNAETIRLETTGQVEFDKYGSQTFTGTSASYLIATSSGDIIEKTPAQVRSDIGAGTGSGTVTGTGSSGRVAFWSDTSVLSSSASLYYDGVNTRLGIGTSSITSSRLDVYSTTADPHGVVRVTQAVASNDPTMIIEHTVAGGNANEDTGLVVKSVGSGAGNQFVLNTYKENGTDYAFKVNGGGDTYSSNDAYIEGSVVFSSDDGATCSKVDWLEFVCPDTGTSVNSKIGYLETNFPDNSKVTFGDSSDLKIWHDSGLGTSYISDQGTGNLYIQADSKIRLESYAATEKFAIFELNGAADIYYDNSLKLSTTNTGINITGGFTTSASSSCAGLNMTSDIAMAGNTISLSSNSVIENDGNGGMVLNDAPTGNEGNGIIIKRHSTGTTAGYCYYLSHLAATWGAANASDVTQDGATRMLAIALSTNSSDGMLLQGIFRKAMHGFSAGAPLYVGTTDGLLSTSPPTTSGYIARIVGYAIDSNTIYFNPSGTWVEIA